MEHKLQLGDNELQSIQESPHYISPRASVDVKPAVPQRDDSLHTKRTHFDTPVKLYDYFNHASTLTVKPIENEQKTCLDENSKKHVSFKSNWSTKRKCALSCAITTLIISSIGLIICFLILLDIIN